MFKSLFIPLLTVASLAINGCAAFEIATQTRTLSEGGFLARVPETEEQRQSYAALPAYKLYRGTKDGRVFYAYKDEKTGVVYIGNEEDYKRYMVRVRRLVEYFETTEQKMAAHVMDNDLQRRWPAPWSGEMPKEASAPSEAHR